MFAGKAKASLVEHLSGVPLQDFLTNKLYIRLGKFAGTNTVAYYGH
jgi:hypothetical protein